MTSTGRTERIHSVDVARGAVMILMALDHVRDFFHAPAMTRSPTNLATTTAATFLARWITHFCAPMFLLLAGVGARLWLVRNGQDTGRLSRYLLVRGLILVALELTAMRLALDFTFRPSAPILLMTLWALGVSMIILAGLIHLPDKILAILSVAVILLHNLFDGVRAQRFGSVAWLWNVLHQPGAFAAHGITVVVAYPLLPLAAVMAAGYCLGSVYLKETAYRRSLLLRLGAVATVAFILLRAANVYGDPFPWSLQPSAVMTMLSFLNTTKYPASLDFLLMTLGPALLLLGWIDGVHLSGSNPLLVFGRAPLFYFVVHFFWIHILTIVSTFLRYGPADFLFLTLPSMGGPIARFPADFGYGLGTVVLIWMFVVATMYPLCKWVASLKTRDNSRWLTYL